MHALDGPGVGFRLAPRPDLPAEHRGAVLRAGFELHRVPAARLPGEGDRLREMRRHLGRPRAKLELLARAHQVERVPLRDESHVGHPGLLERGGVAELLRESVGITAGRRRGVGGGRSRFLDARLPGPDVGPDAVVLQADRTDPALAPRALGNRRHLHQALRAVHFTHHVAIPHADPGERRLTPHSARLRVGAERDVVKVEAPRERWHRADTRSALETADLRRHDRGGVNAGGRRVAAILAHRAGGRGKLGGRLPHESSGRIVEPHRERQGSPGLNLHLGRHDLHPGGFARRALRARRHLLRCRCLRLRHAAIHLRLRAEAVEPGSGREEHQPVPGDRRCRHLVLVIEPHAVDELQAILRRLEHVPAARRADVEFAVGHQRAAPDDRAEEFDGLAHGAAGLLVEGVNLSAVVYEVNPAIEDDRHRAAVHHALLLPGDAGRRDVARAHPLEASYRAHRRVVEVLLRL